MAKVLVVDDSPLMRTIIGDYLKNLGHESIPAGTAEEAFAACEDSEPDLIIKDLVMKDTDPLEFLQELMRRKPGLPIVICSTIGRKQEIFSALKAGAVDFLVKPFHPHEVAGLISRYALRR